jgi:hypothetical protein
MDQKIEEMKFSAVMHGADPKEMKMDSSKSSGDNTLFRDPKDYEGMSDQEKKDLSDKMKKKFMGWAGAKKNG